MRTSSKTVEYPVLAQHRVTVSTDEDPGLSVPEDIVLLQQPYNVSNHHHEAEAHRTACDHIRRGASPRPPLNIQIPPSRPSWILFLRSVGLLSVLIQTPAMALSKISLSSIKPKPEKRFRGCFSI